MPIHVDAVHVGYRVLHVWTRVNADRTRSLHLWTDVCRPILRLQLSLLLHDTLPHQCRVLLLLRRRGRSAVDQGRLSVVALGTVCVGLILLKGCLVLGLVLGLGVIVGASDNAVTPRSSINGVLASLSSLHLFAHVLVCHLVYLTRRGLRVLRLQIMLDLRDGRHVSR